MRVVRELRSRVYSSGVRVSNTLQPFGKFMEIVNIDYPSAEKKNDNALSLLLARAGRGASLYRHEYLVPKEPEANPQTNSDMLRGFNLLD